VGETEAAEQLELIRSRLPRMPRRAPVTAESAATTDPVALVQVDTGLVHLDRPFEYTVPESLAQAARPGVRVKVRFAGQDLDGFVLERRSRAEHEGRLAPLRKVVSPEPVLVPTLLAAARATAQRYAGTLGDVLRLAIPPRHAAAEKALAAEAPPAPGLPEPPGVSAWDRYAAGRHFLGHVTAGAAPAAAWLAAPTTDPAADWPAALAEAARAAVEGGRGAVIVVPDHRDVARVDRALTALLGPGRHVRLTADQGPQARYTAWLKVLRGHVQVVVGTRAAAFAPVHDLGLAAWWDDGDDLHEEPRAPYPHVREILAARARLEGAALLAGGFARTTAVQAWVESGELKPIAARLATVRAAAPRVLVAGEGAELERDPAAASAHLPSIAWRTAKEALAQGPVLVQVPRRGYLPSLSCQTCRAPARCAQCNGPLALPAAGAAPACRWCGTTAAGFECTQCGDRQLRSAVVGARRTAEELGRAFPGVPVHTSGSGEVLDRVAGTPSLVIATPGAEPVADGGYAAVLLLDAWASLDRPVLAAGEESVRRWLGAAALARGGAERGVAVLCGAPGHTTIPAVETVVRWDPAWFAERELAERRELRLPPTVRMASLTAPRRTLQEALSALRLPEGVETLGPLPVGEGTVRFLLRTSLDDSAALASALVGLKGVRSAHKDAVTIAVRVDPPDIGS
jgi:primosomal protein N' (replication factor Y)